MTRESLLRAQIAALEDERDYWRKLWEMTANNAIGLVDERGQATARVAELEAALRQNGVPSPRPWYQTGGNKVDMNAVDGTDYAIMAARIAELEARLASFGPFGDGWHASEDVVRIDELETSLRAIAAGKDWGSNGFDLDGEFRLSRKAMKAEARRALERKP